MGAPSNPLEGLMSQVSQQQAASSVAPEGNPLEGLMAQVTGKKSSAVPAPTKPSIVPTVSGVQGAPPSLPDPIAQDAARAQADVRAAGPNTVPGAAEAGMGFGQPASQVVGDATRAVTQGAMMAAPVLTAGASLPVQMAAQGAVSGADTAARGGSAKATARDAAIGAILPAGGALIGAAISKAKNVFDVAKTMSEGFTSELATVAHNEGLPPITSETAREAADELQKSFIDRAKSQYSVVDKAVEGDLKPVQERITSLKKAIRAQANVNPDLADKYIEDLANQQKTLSNLVERAKANGVPNAEELMQAGDKDYARGMAMKKVSAGVKTASGEVKMGGHPNPHMFATQIDRMNNTGLLQRALGDDGAKAMVDLSKQGLSKAKTAAVAGKVIKAAGAGAVGATGYAVAKHALSNQ